MPRFTLDCRLQGLLLVGSGAVCGAIAVISASEVRGQKAALKPADLKPVNHAVALKSESSDRGYLKQSPGCNCKQRHNR